MQCTHDLQNLTVVALFLGGDLHLIAPTEHTGEETDSDLIVGHHCFPGLAQRLAGGQ